ncbi:MAG: hypothetical protein ACYC91_17200 [Solirubrobacteraceae bacterium]
MSSTLIVEYAGSFLYERESEHVRPQGGTGPQGPHAHDHAGAKLASALGRQLDDKTAERLGTAAHLAFGSGGGPLIVMLAHSGMDPVKAGLAVGMGMCVLVDEGLNPAAGLTAGPRARTVHAPLRHRGHPDPGRRATAANRHSELLVVTGRAPRVNDIGLETVGIEPNPRGIETDERCAPPRASGRSATSPA